jgi:HD-GYP domain-containing protein (c-di-GMP phosphodiesterase class II)
MKTHPEEGYKIAKQLGITNEKILNGIRYHHEKYDGSGYPQRLRKNMISQYAQIISICDVFDALTTKRSYKDALSTFDALKLMKEKFKTELNMDIVVHFIRYLYTVSH